MPGSVEGRGTGVERLRRGDGSLEVEVWEEDFWPGLVIWDKMTQNYRKKMQ